MMSQKSRKGYTEIILILNSVGHLEVPVEVDGIATQFLLDTGAGNTVIDIGFANENQMKFNSIEMMGGGVGTSTLGLFHMLVSVFKIHTFEITLFDLYAADFLHVKETLANKGITDPANGVIGADILVKYSANIDYEKKRLYIKNISH